MEDYKEKQKKYREMRKMNQRMIWVSKDASNPLIKGRTYVKPINLVKKVKEKVNDND